MTSEPPGVRAWLAPWLDADGTLTSNPAAIAALLAAWDQTPPEVRAGLRLSRHFRPWLERHRRLVSRQEARAAFLAEVAAGQASLEVLTHPLLPYQRDGMLHLAFGERALLADEMGLGKTKTVQAIGACELLARRKGITRALVICPASVKAEWEEQIARFTGRASRFVAGPRVQRLAAYGEAPPFFTIVNYEQVVGDADDINRLLKPDVVILDEAQRIKNWQTKTARRVKSLRSAYAFVLTGTPVENRIDEVYSIVQYLDPEILGPLFRFNREFYQLDERGRPVDYQNLADLHRRLGPVMLRRRKAEVESQLPGRTVKTYFVPMADEQKLRYEDYRQPAQRLAEEPGRKVVVFSEWERMLELVRELAGEMGVECAWHTGSTPQLRRRAEIARFKQDPNCRLFLSTDAGAVGLNLQAASAVVNVDLPWNPAKLEQRIARAWRKHQTRTVTVVNLVTEASIEHGILHLLGQKQDLADGVLDGAGDLDALKMPCGRAAMIERMQAMMAAADTVAPRILSPEEALAEDLVGRWGERTLLVEARAGAGGTFRLLVVLDLDAATLAAERDRLAARETAAALPVEVIDAGTWATMRRLAAGGLVQFPEGLGRTLHRAASLAAEATPSDGAARAADLLAQAGRSARMAAVLAGGGFADEAVPLLAKALGEGAAAVLARQGKLAADATAATPEQIRDLAERGALPPATLPTLTALWPSAIPRSGADVIRQAETTASILAAIGGAP